MSINLSFIGQIITFLIFIWFTMRYVWPPIIKAMHERQKRIAEGLAASDLGKKELELAHHKTTELLRDAKLEASHIIEQANKRALHLIEEAKEQARVEARQILANAEREVHQLVATAKETLRLELSDLVISGAKKVISKEIDEKSHSKMLDELVAELA